MASVFANAKKGIKAKAYDAEGQEVAVRLRLFRQVCSSIALMNAMPAV